MLIYLLRWWPSWISDRHKKHIFCRGPSNDHSLYKIYVFYVDRKSKMAATAIHRLILDPMGKYSNAFFSETTNIIKTKLYMNVHLKKQKFCRGPSNDHSCAVWFQLSKWFQRRSVLKHFSHRVQC
jgi:hypothetical protein